MPPVICTMSISIDGYGTGPNQTEERPFGDIPEDILHRWMVDTPEESPREMEGGSTTFQFVTDGIESALAGAREAAGDLPIHIAGGPTTANQYLAAGLVDELRLQIVPVVLGRGERLFDGVPLVELEQLSARPVSLATHVHYRVVR